MPPPRSPLPISVPPPFVLSFCFTIGLPHARHPHTGRRQIKGTKATHCMFRHTFQSGFLSILYSLGNKPLQLWDKSLHNGSIKRVGDEDVSSGVLELVGENVAENFIACPADSKDQLGIKLPWLVLVVKNLHEYFTFEVHVLDDKGVKRRLRASN
ncbi:transcription factor, partial [Nannochloropsis gaditana CCMP526]|uniref:transcription factor n=1 Tax=Nannochloropsis gaditana (strain CCMP526) TaxID=1093141 RepID=UPI00029F5FA4